MVLCTLDIKRPEPKVLKLASFQRWMKREKLTDRTLWKAINSIQNGKIDAHLGGGLMKQRIARPGSGKSGGYRVLLVYQTRQRVIFLKGFAKQDMANISQGTLRRLKSTAHALLNLSEQQTLHLIKSRQLIEARSHEQSIQ